MAGFRKAEPKQAKLKVAMYGPPGSGKTFSALLFAEGLASAIGSRVAMVDTERGTDFYAQRVEERSVHPDAFDFDCSYTRSLTEVLGDVRGLDPKMHGVLIIDSITHLWEAAQEAFTGRTKAGTIPMHAWGKIKAPYKALLQHLINCPQHVFILGRQANEYDSDETTEMKKVGVKMAAEKDTPYEPHICFRMELVRKKGGVQVPTLHVEKDRTGILQGRVFPMPTFDQVIRPLLKTLGAEQAQLPSAEEAASQDAESIAEQDRQRDQSSRAERDYWVGQMMSCKTRDELEQVSAKITPTVKRTMINEHVQEVRSTYLARCDSLPKS